MIHTRTSYPFRRRFQIWIRVMLTRRVWVQVHGHCSIVSGVFPFHFLFPMYPVEIMKHLAIGLQEENMLVMAQFVTHQRPGNCNFESFNVNCLWLFPFRFVTSPQFIKKGKRGAKPGVPHKRRNCSKPLPPSNVSTEDCSEKPTSFYVNCNNYSTYFGSEWILWMF